MIEKNRLAAIRDCHKTYVGMPCKRCGSSVRYTSSGGCVACVKATSTAKARLVRELINSKGGAQ